MSTVVLSPYQPHWITEFQAASAELRAVVGPEVQIEHIGSTAVPGLCAKPVLDILAGAEDLKLFEAKTSALLRLGYRYRSEYEALIPNRRYFTREEAEVLKVHLHCVLLGRAIWREHLAFRDALRASPTLLAQYATLKGRLAVEHAANKADYTNAKAPFIRRVLAARSEA